MQQKQLEKNKQFFYRHINRVLVNLYSQKHNRKKIVKKQPFVSIIMLSFNRVEDTIFSIKQIFKYTKVPFELIVLDNDSDENQKKILKKFLNNRRNVKFLESNTNLGCAKGRSFAAKNARGKYYFFVDNDVVVTPYYLENLISTIEQDKKTVAVCSQVIYPDLTIQFSGGTMIQDKEADIFNLMDSGKLFFDSRLLKISRICPWIPGGSTLWKAKYYKKFPIDEKMEGSFEDNEVSRRISKAGYNVRSCPHSITIHYHMDFKDSQFATREVKYMQGRYNNDRTKVALRRYWKVHKRIFIFNCEEAVYAFLPDISRDNIKKFLKEDEE